MKKRILSVILALATLGCSGQNNQPTEFGSGNVKVSVEQASEWLHNFPIFWFIKKKPSLLHLIGFSPSSFLSPKSLPHPLWRILA